ncbi:MAG: methionine--tRNA ligase [Patescibacteria group bacterium]
MAKFYITTPIFYVNDKPHVGHAYTVIVADVLARYHRMRGDEVFYLTGTDEHGVKIQEIAEKQGKQPKELADGISAKFRLAWDTLNISNDGFMRTTDAHHEDAVRYALSEMYKQEWIYKGSYEALYCVGCEQYKMKSELVEGKCTDHNREPEVHSEEAYLFKLSHFAPEILKRIKSEKIKILPVTRHNEMVSFLELEGLNDIAISRRKEKVAWGIELPFDPNHTTYVWVDAFLNYITGLGWPKDKTRMEKFWPANVQLMSKDILRVHATIWQAILLALGLETSQTLFIHGFFTVDGQKMSKSLGNVVDPMEIAQTYGADVLRYHLMREISFGSDGDFSLRRLEERHESDLANGIGNLVARVLGMAEKYTGGKVPEITASVFSNVWDAYGSHFEKFQPDQALSAVWGFITDVDKFIDTEQPWVLAKTDTERLNFDLYILLESLRHLGRLVWPFMPSTAEKIFTQLGLPDELKVGYDEGKKWGGLQPGTRVTKGEGLFPRLIPNP